jgi:hypothetical protein
MFGRPRPGPRTPRGAFRDDIAEYQGALRNHLDVADDDASDPEPPAPFKGGLIVVTSLSLSKRLSRRGGANQADVNRPVMFKDYNFVILDGT